MIAVTVEVWPHHQKREQLTTMAAVLRPALEQVDGFVSMERFESLIEPGKILVVMFWRDEECLTRWQRSEEYRRLMAAIRNEMVKKYRARVARVERDFGIQDL
jgi:heme-degrading monooxygenase HmoA